ncbi:OsmC family protein [Taibaiella koreensis]|uniref:OsmC family protein n=1 Tax=Taibaiella koreensis TaxID=1268548 RepID=UPI000E5A053F|nr:OsmC family protein [Taibaiella koreensis]
MSQLHHYKTTIEWTGNKGTGTSGYTAYERSHSIRVDGKADIAASSDKAFRGDAARHNPEDLFLASLASCHMLWYLHLCADAGVIVESYTDEARGTMETQSGGSGRFTEVVLSPRITISHSDMLDQAYRLHHKAHEMCFLANSVNFEILIQPKIKSS